MTLESEIAGIEVLVVEDSMTQRMMLQHCLETHKCRVTTASDGHEALSALATKRPALVITDINMPRMDGYELCQRIKDDTALKDIPVILLTSLSDPQDILKGLECGADNFIVKPYDEEFLISRIQFVLTNRDLRSQAGGGESSEIFFAGRKYHLTATRIRSLDLLLSTYETAVQKNLELSKAKELLERQAGELREKNAQMKAELDMAQELQTAFLPHSHPSFPSSAAPDESALRFHHRYLATTELGGDFFDIAALSDTEAAVFICDVMGHGVRAALVTAIMRGLVEEFRSVAGDPGPFLASLNRRFSEVLKQTSTTLFASAYYIVVDVARGELRYAGAGHPAPMFLRARDGTVEPLACEGIRQGGALGLGVTGPYTTCRQPIAPGDRLVLFTDGLYEVEGADEAFYDTQMLLAAARKHAALPMDALFDHLLDEVRQFSASHAFDDDVCLVGVEVMKLVNR